MADILTPYPTNPGFEAVNFRINTPAIISETNSGRVRRVGYGHSYYSFDVKYRYLTYDQAGVVMSFLATAQGQLLSFEIVLPEISVSDAPAAAAATLTATVQTTVNAGVKSVTLANCGANKNILNAGDYFRFNNHSKVYMSTTNVTSNGSGLATVTFSGSLVSQVPSGTGVFLTNVPFTVVLSEPTQEYEVSQRGITTLSVSMREVW